MKYLGNILAVHSYIIIYWSLDSCCHYVLVHKKCTNDLNRTKRPLARFFVLDLQIFGGALLIFPDFNDFMFSFDLMCYSFRQKRTMFQQKSGKTGNAPPKYLQIQNEHNHVGRVKIITT